MAFLSILEKVGPEPSFFASIFPIHSDVKLTSL